MKNSKYDDLFIQIGSGKENALSRPQNPLRDRRLRKSIENAQGKGDIIINVGDGYYRPDLSNPVEAAEFRHYINQKRSRIRAQMKTITAMENAANNADTSIDN